MDKPSERQRLVSEIRKHAAAIDINYLTWSPSAARRSANTAIALVVRNGEAAVTHWHRQPPDDIFALHAELDLVEMFDPGPYRRGLGVHGTILEVLLAHEFDRCANATIKRGGAMPWMELDKGAQASTKARELILPVALSYIGFYGGDPGPDTIGQYTEHMGELPR